MEFEIKWGNDRVLKNAFLIEIVHHELILTVLELFDLTATHEVN
jgi:hypothetical protein